MYSVATIKRIQLSCLTLPRFPIMLFSIGHHYRILRDARLGSLRGKLGTTPLLRKPGSRSYDKCITFPYSSQFIDLQYQGVRLLNSRGRLTRNISYDGPLIGCMVHDPTDDRQKFVLYRANSINHGRNLSGIYILDSAVNDFCFRHDESLQGKHKPFT